MLRLNENLESINIRQKIKQSSYELEADIAADKARNLVDDIVEQNGHTAAIIQKCYDKIISCLQDTNDEKTYTVINAEALTQYLLKEIKSDVPQDGAIFVDLTNEGIIDGPTILELRYAYSKFTYEVDYLNFELEQEDCGLWLEIVDENNLDDKIQNGMQVKFYFEVD